MKLKILGSSSEGNCYILENDKEALILEAGVSFGKVKKALDILDGKEMLIDITAHQEYKDMLAMYDRLEEKKRDM